jgi:hypothetical protein
MACIISVLLSISGELLEKLSKHPRPPLNTGKSSLGYDCGSCTADSFLGFVRKFPDLSLVENVDVVF